MFLIAVLLLIYFGIIIQKDFLRFGKNFTNWFLRIGSLLYEKYTMKLNRAGIHCQFGRSSKKMIYFYLQPMMNFYL